MAAVPEPPQNERDRRIRRTVPRPGGRRIRDDVALKEPFEVVLLSISDQVYALQARHGMTLRQLAGPDLSEQGVLDILKTTSDPKISTLVRLAARYDHEIVIAFRPRRMLRPHVDRLRSIQNPQL